MATMTQPNASEMKMRKARNQMICCDPFFASLALRLVLVEDTKCKTMWTDGTRIGYNPEFLDKMSMDETKGVIVHEVLHCANKHHLRRGQRDFSRWNQACDYAINYILKAAGYKLPDGCLDNKAYHNMSAEEIYTMLPVEDNGGKGGQGQGDGGIGEVRDFDPHDKDKTGQNPTASEKAENGTDWDMGVANAEKAAKAMGKGVCDAVKRMIGDLSEARVNWREVVARFVQTEVARNDYSWQRPNVRHLQRGFILPSLYSHTFGKVALAIDTSGSVGDQEVKDMISEVIGILELYQDSMEEVRLPVIYCDTEVRGVDYLAIGDEPNPLGGGGTDFRPPFEHLAQLDEDVRPVALIYLTDGECDSFPSEAPSIPVIWGLTQRNRDFKPPFGDVLCMLNN